MAAISKQQRKLQMAEQRKVNADKEAAFNEMISRRREGKEGGFDWFVIRTEPGAQQPRRLFEVEATEPGKNGKVRGKGYKIVPSLNPSVSAIEHALKEAGFTYYMPSEKRLIRDRRHTDLYKVRRFALMVGYVFICNPHSFPKLEATPGVSGIVANQDGKPLNVDFLDIMAVRSVEAASEVEFDRRSVQARRELRKKAKKDTRLQKLIAEFDIAGTISIPLNSELLAAA
jgi:hypothetical protein